MSAGCLALAGHEVCVFGRSPRSLERGLAAARDGMDLLRYLAEDGRALAFLARLAEIAERESHHPDFCLTRRTGSTCR